MQTQPSPTSARSRREQRQADLSARLAREQASSRQRRIVTLAASGIVVLVVALIAVRLITTRSSSTTPDEPAPDSLIAQVSSVDPRILDQVGRGSISQLPTPIRAGLERG